jgi:MATE family multidrug resistance protein
LAAETDRTNNVEEEGYFIMDYFFMHDFRFHFISDYILFKFDLNGSTRYCGKAKPYLDIVLSLSFHLLFWHINNLLMKSDTKSSMWATIIGNVINVIVNYFLIYGIWIFPEMGIVGAAIGTIVSRVVMLVLCITS